MITHMPPAPRRNAAKIRSGTCSSDNNEDNFVVFDRRVMAGIGFISDKHVSRAASRADVIRQSFRLRRPAFVPQSRDYSVSRRQGRDKGIVTSEATENIDSLRSDRRRLRSPDVIEVPDRSPPGKTSPNANSTPAQSRCISTNSRAPGFQPRVVLLKAASYFRPREHPSTTSHERARHETVRTSNID
jgi:hypothetical protein